MYGASKGFRKQKWRRLEQGFYPWGHSKLRRMFCSKNNQSKFRSESRPDRVNRRCNAFEDQVISSHPLEEGRDYPAASCLCHPYLADLRLWIQIWRVIHHVRRSSSDPCIILYLNNKLPVQFAAARQEQCPLIHVSNGQEEIRTGQGARSISPYKKDRIRWTTWKAHGDYGERMACS